MDQDGLQHRPRPREGAEPYELSESAEEAADLSGAEVEPVRLEPDDGSRLGLDVAGEELGMGMSQGVGTGGSLHQRRGWVAWVCLVGVLVVAAVPMGVAWSVVEGVTPVERAGWEMAAQTLERAERFEAAGDPWSLEHVVPTRDGRAVLDTWPGVPWLKAWVLSLGAEAGGAGPVGPEPIDEAEAVDRLRLVGVVAALLVVASAYWAGLSVGGLLTAGLSGLIAAAMPALVWRSVTVGPGVVVAAWVGLAVASALWASRPLRPTPALGRQALGWLLCGSALGAAVLSAGPRAALLVVVPLFLMIVLVPGRVGHMLGLLAALCVATLCVTPWALEVHQQDPLVWESWVSELRPEGWSWVSDQLAGLLGTEPTGVAEDAQGTAWLAGWGWRMGWAAVLLGLWVLWLPAGVAQAFSTSSSAKRAAGLNDLTERVAPLAVARRRMLLGWLWTASTLTLVLGFPVGELAESRAFGPAREGVVAVLPLVASMAVLLGATFRQFHDLSAEGRHARLWRWTRWGSSAGVVGLSVVLPLACWRQDDLIAWGWLDRPWVEPMHWAYAAGGGVAMLAVAVGAARFAQGHHPARAVGGWCLWVVMTSALAWPVVMDQGTRSAEGATVVRVESGSGGL
ncbi:MAG: hypothetical protein AAGI68_14120 [Planctomycetota bacterium]